MASPFDYARRRYHETKRHYFVTDQGHTFLDCIHNRIVCEELELAIVFMTRWLA